MEDGIEAGFQLSVLRGPLCDEPLQGVAVFIQDVEQPSSSVADGEHLVL